MNSLTEKKQADIKKIVEELISLEDIVGISGERQLEYLDGLLFSVSKILSGDKFRPHYYFINSLLEKENLNSLISFWALVDTIQEKLSEIMKWDKNDVEKLLNNMPGIFTYYFNDVFRYNMDMFLEALHYECSVQKTVIKNKNDIAEIQAKIDVIIQSPQKIINEETEKYKSTLASYSKEFNEKLEKANTLKDETIKEINDHQITVNDMNNDMGNIRSDMGNIRTEMSSLITNVLTILGIFVSIIFVIVGAYFTVSNERILFSSIVQVNLGKFVLMGHILFNLLFLFMHMIAKLSGKSIALACLGCDNSVCEKGKCTFPMRLMNRYPYVIVTNFVAVGMYIVLTAWWFLEEFVYRTHYEELHSAIGQHPLIFSCTVITICILLIAVPIKLMINYRKKKSS